MEQLVCKGKTRRKTDGHCDQHLEDARAKFLEVVEERHLAVQLFLVLFLFQLRIVFSSKGHCVLLWRLRALSGVRLLLDLLGLLWRRERFASPLASRHRRNVLLREYGLPNSPSGRWWPS